MVTVTDELRERLLSYVSHQVSRGTDSIKSAVEKGQTQLFGVIDGLSEEQAAFKPDADTWSVVEVLRHVEESKRGIARICGSLARGEVPAPLGTVGSIDDPPFSSLAEARTVLDASHQELLAFVDTVLPETNVAATYAHPWFGPLNCQEWAVFQRIHDGDHAEQIEQVKAAPGFPTA